MRDTKFGTIAIAVLGLAGIALIISGAFQTNQGQEQMQQNKKQASNRLIQEKSPYLLQHAYNPVDWYPWGEEAFAKAAAEDKPIFLSIGYSTCHWCHVMEHESFEDSTVASLMNQSFVNIKVDREERPDVDDVYMTVCQMMTGSGGWPLTILMTPDKKPFYAATYIPRESRYNRPGMIELIPRIDHIWKNERAKIFESAGQIESHLQKSINYSAGEPLNEALLNRAYQQFESTFDPQNGGFNQRPKFPTPHNLMFLLRYYHRTGQPQALHMVEKTLTKMRYGGIYDHIGKGFHRYSTDEKWLLPHFEKMLYDQAMLLIAYTEAYQVTGNPLFRDTAADILSYVLRDMTSPEGGFYAAEDADSEGEEGKFYVWSKREVLQVLGQKEGEWFSQIFNIAEAGNFLDEATGETTATNIPHLRRSYSEIASAEQVNEADLQKRINKNLKRLFDHREERIHPLKDDKVLTDWNGLMIAASARAFKILGEEEYLNAAESAFAFVEQNMMPAPDRLLHRYRDGEAGIEGFLDDYAFLMWGATELFEATGNPRYLQRALQLNEVVQQKFYDDNNYGYFFTANDAEALLIRKKEIYDGAIPSGNSVMMLNQLRLARMTGEMSLEKSATAIGRAFSEQVINYPAGHALLMSALDFSVGPIYEMVFVAQQLNKAALANLAELNRPFMPNKVTVVKTHKTATRLAELAGYTRDMDNGSDNQLIYVCRDFACQLPVSSAKQALQLLQQTRK